MSIIIILLFHSILFSEAVCETVIQQNSVHCFLLWWWNCRTVLCYFNLFVFAPLFACTDELLNSRLHPINGGNSGKTLFFPSHFMSLWFASCWRCVLHHDSFKFELEMSLCFTFQNAFCHLLCSVFNFLPTFAVCLCFFYISSALVLAIASWEFPGRRRLNAVTRRWTTTTTRQVRWWSRLIMKIFFFRTTKQQCELDGCDLRRLQWRQQDGG